MSSGNSSRVPSSPLARPSCRWLGWDVGGAERAAVAPSQQASVAVSWRYARFFLRV